MYTEGTAEREKDREMEKEQWKEKTEKAEEIINSYLNRKDGCFDDMMAASFCECNDEEQSVTIEFATQKWQINERGGIHGGAIAGMFDTSLGVVANLIAGENEAATADMQISFMRPIAYGEHAIAKIYVVKAGRTMIRLRGELFCKESGKLTASATGSFIPL